MKSYGITDIGRIRQNNEDRFLIRRGSNGVMLLAVADGISGEAGGEVAAQRLIQMLMQIPLTGNLDEQLLVQKIIEVDKEIYEKASEQPDLEGMGSTLTAAIIHDSCVQWAHVGDSRIYLYSKEKLVQISEDQNLAAFLVSENQITKHEARYHPLRHLLEQAVGCGSCEPATGHFQVRHGDKLLLCSDGLNNELDDTRIAAILEKYSDLEQAARELMSAALDAGGRDNITVLLAEL